MPILEDDLFFGRNDPLARFESLLPTRPIMDGAQISPHYSQILAELPAAQVINAAANTRSIGAGIATTLGIADYVLDATDTNPLGRLAKLSDLDLSFVPSAFSEDPAKLVAELGLEVMDEIVDRVFTKVPILGWIASAGLFIWRAVKTIRTQIETSPPETYKNGIAYHRDTDEDLANKILGAVRSGAELTDLYLPAVGGSGTYFGESKTRTPAGAEGIALEPFGVPTGGRSLIPGTADMGDVVQYPVIGIRGGPTTFGQLHPSCSQLGLVLWQSILKNGPLAFQLNGQKIITAWERYFDAMLHWAASHGSGAWADRHWLQAGSVATWAMYGAGTQGIKATDYYPEQQSFPGMPDSPACPGDRICIPERYCDWRSREFPHLFASKGGLVRYFVEQQWARRLRFYLGTLTCAYVPADAPALASEGLRDYHEEMRRLLLTHRARYKVDKSMIPDDGTGYRADFARSVRTPDIGLAVGSPGDDPDPPKIPAKLAIVVDDVDPIDPGLDAAPELVPVNPAIPGTGDLGGPGGFGASLIAGGIGLAVLGGGLYFVRRRRRAR